MNSENQNKPGDETQQLPFITKKGTPLHAISTEQSQAIRLYLERDLGISPLQIAESAGSSMGMVVRSALGLSATDGQVAIFSADNLSGWIALVAARHLLSAGALPVVVLLASSLPQSNEQMTLLKPIEKNGVPIFDWSPTPDESALTTLLQSSHNAIVGAFDLFTMPSPEVCSALSTVLNEEATPLHSIQFPLGVNPSTGEAGNNPLYSSSTLSLGLPLKGAIKGNEFLGRHYLTDISIPRAGIPEIIAEQPVLFNEQPVVLISPS